ncbi:MAG: hypothetical protein GXO85_03420 [Chlorobi bacterium]|nr:hypothetical protein [Chlorobiota bacterium]
MLQKNSFFTKLFYVSIFVFLSTFLFQTCSNDNPVSPPDGNGNEAKLDTIINVDMSDATITYKDNVSILIPQGTVSGDTKLIVKELTSSSVPTDSEMEFPNTYEITLGNQHIFDKPLKITLKYDPQKLNEGKLKYKIGAAYYDETLKRWALFQDVSVDSVENTVSFTTSHLTKLSWWKFKKVLGYTDYLTSPHFIIYWTDGTVPSNTDYKSSLTSHKGTAPYYIQDILYYLEEARQVYEDQKLTVPKDTTNKVEVRILELSKGEDGNTSYFGFIRISQNIKADNEFSQEELVKITCAHELFHFVQDYYYMFTFEGNIIKWWLEATAVQADRIVWPNKSKFEAVNYADGLINGQLERSWDDCNSDPNYYIAGGFLTYLTTYRDGPKLSIPKIIMETGKASNVHYFRTILNTYLKNNLSSYGIGHEYRDYIRWAYEHNGPIKINYSPPLQAGNGKYVVPVRLTETDPSWNGNVTIPYLAAKIVKIISPTSQGSTTFKIVVNNQDTQIEQYVYVTDKDRTVYKKYLIKNDTLKINLESKNQWIDILSCNIFKDDNGSFDLSVELIQAPTITSITPSTASVGEVVQIKGNNFGASQNNSEVWFGAVKALASDIVSWLDNQIDVKVPEGAVTGDVHIVADGEKSNDVSFTVKDSLIVNHPGFESWFSCVLHRTFSNGDPDDYSTFFSPYLYAYEDSTMTINNNVLSYTITYNEKKTIKLILTVDDLRNPTLITDFEYTETIDDPTDQYGDSFFEKTKITGKNVPLSFEDSGVDIKKFKIEGDVSSNIINIEYTSTSNNSVTGYWSNYELTSYDVTNSKIYITYSIE